ncbi:hypothetical protein JL721_1673 [Aureococcus anophagefferens]|nr:hypothetical protein JL721_1673 [Aureococcus anophagefferens]
MSALENALLEDDSDGDDDEAMPAAPPVAPPARVTAAAPPPLAPPPLPRSMPPRGPGIAARQLPNATFAPIANPDQRRPSPSKPRASSGQSSMNLQQLLQDVVQQLGKEERIRFREFVQELKAKRDAGEIPPLSGAAHGRRRSSATTSGAAPARSRTRGRGRRARRRGARPRREARASADRDAAEARALQLEAPAAGSTLADEVQKQADLLSNGDLNVMSEKVVSTKRETSGADAETSYGAWDKCNLVDEPTASRRLHLAAENCAHLPGGGRKAPKLTHDDEAATSRPCRELLSRGAAVRATPRGAVALSQRRRNEEARRVATNPETCGLALRWLDRDVDRHVVDSRRQCEKTDVLLDAMVDHDLLSAPPVDPREPPATSTWARAKRARATDLDRSTKMDDLGRNLERGITKVKREEDADKRRADRGAAQIPEKPDVITKADVKHLLRSRREFSKLLF